MKPSIDIVKRLAEKLTTTVDYLLGEMKKAQLLKDPAMLKCFLPTYLQYSLEARHISGVDLKNLTSTWCDSSGS